MDGDKGKMVAAAVLAAQRRWNNRLAGPSAAPWIWHAHAFREVDLARWGVFSLSATR